MIMKVCFATKFLNRQNMKIFYPKNIIYIKFSFSDPPELLLGIEGGAPPKHRYSGEGRPSRADVVEQWARQSSGHAQRLASSTSIHRRGSEGNF